MIKYALVLLLLLSILSPLSAQPRNRPEGIGQISGSVRDSITEVPIEYASLLLFSQQDSTRAGGIATDTKGRYTLTSLRPGSYFMQVSFLGYLPKTIEDIRISREQAEVVVPEILLVPTALQGSEVVIEGERAAVEYRLDKKVVNVAKQATTISGTAVDVLENVPSVSVDIEGNVSLRGSSNFTVLVDGRPSILDANEALQLIPASTIESIEIITNPSAKYNPEGTAGIFNIILLKNRSDGVSGMVNARGGTNDTKGGDILFTRKYGRVSWLVGGDYNERNHPGSTESRSWTRSDGVTSYVNTDGSRKFGMTGYGFRSEIEWNPDDKNMLSLGTRLGSRSRESNSDLLHEEWSDQNSIHDFYTSANESEGSGDYYSLYSNYRYRIAPKGHELSASGQYNHRVGDATGLNERLGEAGDLVSGKKTKDSNPHDMGLLEVNYLRETSSDRKVEAGYSGKIARSGEDNVLLEYDVEQQEYVYQPAFSHSTRYSRGIHALYATYGDLLGPLGYQLGLRAEREDRRIELRGEDTAFEVNRWDYFPSAHLSMNVWKDLQAMASYSRRIQRAQHWALEPFETWQSDYSVRRGNPGLAPESIDSYEAGFQTRLWTGTASLEAYYRATHDRVERIQSVYSENVTLTTFANVGTDESIGLEYGYDVKLFKLWEARLSGSFYDYRVKGDYQGRSFDEHNFSWNSRLSSTFKLKAAFRLQVDGDYRSPTLTSQGERSGFFTVNAAVAKDFLDNTLTATLQARDLLGTRSHEGTSSGADFYEYSRMEFDSPIISLNVSYRFNNYKAKRDRARGADEIEEESDF